MADQQITFVHAVDAANFETGMDVDISGERMVVTRVEHAAPVLHVRELRWYWRLLLWLSRWWWPWR